MKSARIELLLASTALGLGLVLCAQPGMAQQSDKQIQASVSTPDVAAPAAKDVAAAPADTTKAEPKADTAKPESNKPEATKPDAATPTAEPAKAATAPAPASADATVSDKLRDLITGKKLDRFILRKADREGVESYYSSHSFKPLWVGDSSADARAKAAAGYIAKVDTVGLNPSDYPLPEFKAGATADEQAEAELKFTASILTYARHAQIGQVHFTRVGADISFDLVAPQPAEVLSKLADASDVAAALDSYNPPQEGFKALKKALAELRANDGKTAAAAEEEKKPLVKVGEGKILRPGMKDARVVQLRQRLNVAGDKSSQDYDNAVFEAVKAFQMGAGIGVDGMLGNGTVKALNGESVAGHHPSAKPVDIVLANMERWRWLPRKLGNDNGTYVVVNVPDYSLSLFNDGKLFWHTKIVAGMPGKATPMISAEMKFITVNPTWNVPPSIIEHEYLPALQEDPNALDRIGLKLTQDADGTIHISQPPGAGNALGRIRFNFPNKFLVYQHDTPDKYLFKREKRAYSHGCMRVENPLTYGEKLLSIEQPNEHYTEARLEKMFGGSEININFPKPIPVHLTYQTAFVDADGKLQLREDVYGRDAKMIAILKGSERKVADIAIDRPPNTSSKPVRMPVGMYGGSGGGGSGFFDWLTGGSRAQAGTATYRPRNFIGPGGRYTVR